jgi:hypothetical protein
MPLRELYGHCSSHIRHKRCAAVLQRCTEGKALLRALQLYNVYGACRGVILSVVFSDLALSCLVKKI